MLASAELAQALKTIDLVPVGGPWTRAVGYHHLQDPPPGSLDGELPQPLWPLGAAINGARFTPKDSFGTIYLASDPTTALLEVAAIFDNPNAHAQPFTLRFPPWAVFAVDGVVIKVLDLTDVHIRKALKITPSDLTGSWRMKEYGFGDDDEIPLTHRLGQAAYNSRRIRGILYPSTKNPAGGKGLAIFSDRLTDQDSYLKVFDPRGLLKQRFPDKKTSDRTFLRTSDETS